MSTEDRLWAVLLAALVSAAFAMLWLTHAKAAPPPCTPYLLCPAPGGTGGTGGRAGASGAAGAAGRGGAGAGGRGGGGGGGGGGLVVSAALELDTRLVLSGSTLSAQVTYTNTSSGSITVREIRIAARGPGATHEGGPYTDLAPVFTNLPIAAGESVTLGAARRFAASDPSGKWEAYATHQDSSGSWHDEPSEHFFVAPSSGPTPPPGGGMSVGTQAWFIAAWAGTSYFKSDVHWASAYESGDDIWNPQLLEDLQGYSVWRHMDMNAVNWSKISSWSQRKLPTDPGNAEIYIDASSPANTTGLAVEWQIDLCNRANIDCWFTVPYLADDNYISQQAQLIAAHLSPALKIYVELSNEVWNGQFAQCQQAIDAGKAGGLPGSNDYYVGIAHEMYRALQMFSLYEGVFGASAMGTRVIRVFSESGNLDLTTQALKNVYESAHWNPAGQKIDMIALAPYIGSGTPGASETLSRWKSEVDSKTNGDPIEYVHAHHVVPYAVPLFGCYEGGMHHTSSADAWARNPDAYDGYVYMLDQFSTKMNAPCTLYTLHGTWKTDGSGAWGLFDHVGQDIAQAPKARGTRDWIAGTAMRVSKTLVIVRIVLLVLGILLLVVLLARWATRHRQS